MRIVVIDASNDDIDEGLAVDELLYAQAPDTLGSVLGFDRYIHDPKNTVIARSIPDMVNQILAKLGSDTIERLTIWGHGEPGRQGVGAGDSRFDDTSLGLLMAVVDGRLAESASLARLCHHFSWDATVDLHGCNIALHHSGRQLLRALSDLWHVPVRGGVDVQRSHWDDRFNGPVIEASPGEDGHHSRVHRLNSPG